LIAGDRSTEPPSRRLDQWLWFARLVKSRSLAGRLCAQGAVWVNQAAVRKPSHSIRTGDIVIVPQGPFLHTLRVLALGARRGPAIEARQLYEESTAPVRLSEPASEWTPLLADPEPGIDNQATSPSGSRL
jgi:ribosome-associated heat shock protein Hsp15